MKEFGLEGDEDEQQKIEMRINAFEEAINFAKSNIVKTLEPQTTYHLRTGPSFFASDTTVSPQISVGITEGYLKNDGRTDRSYQDLFKDTSDLVFKTTQTGETAEEKKPIELPYQSNYNSLFSDKPLPEDVTMPELCTMIINQHKSLYTKSSIMQFDKDAEMSKMLEERRYKIVERIYFREYIIDLLERKYLSFNEAIKLCHLFNEHNDYHYNMQYAIRDEYSNAYDIVTGKMRSLAYVKNILTSRESQELILLSNNKFTPVEKNELHEPKKPSSP